MKDFGRSDHPAVQAQLDRLAALSLPQGRLGLETIRELMDRLGNPHRALPPVFHVAGTNGKGSTCAFLRAMLEAEGYRVHATTSPHLVRYNERIRLAGTLIEDEPLAVLLAEVLDASEQGGEDLAPSFFEVTIAAAFLAFSRTPADACVVEVGLGGRFDATNVLEPAALAACGIAALGIDHERFLLAPEEGVPQEPMARIAFEKAGIAKKGVPLVTQCYDSAPSQAIRTTAASVGAPLITKAPMWNPPRQMGQHEWNAIQDGRAMYYSSSKGTIHIMAPGLHGEHQVNNAGLAVAMVLNQSAIEVSFGSIVAGPRMTRWPARLQLLGAGPLTGTREVWLDGGHNLSAGQALAAHFAGQRLHLVIGMIEAKDPAAITGPLAPSLASITAVPIGTHDHHPASAFGPAARAAACVRDAMDSIPDDGLPVLIAGSLYLAGEVLRLNDEMPD